MEIHYSSIGTKITLSASIDDLTRGDQLQLATNLLRAAGVIDALVAIPGVQEAWQAAANKYLAAEPGQISRPAPRPMGPNFSEPFAEPKRPGARAFNNRHED
jgi:hypothetical protein